jgi:PAS domain S-box-containing protein
MWNTMSSEEIRRDSSSNVGNDEISRLALVDVLHEENRQLREALKQCNKVEQKLSGLLDSAPDAMVIVDRQSRIVMINTQTEKMFGYKRDELLDQPLEILLPERFHDGHRKHLAGYFSAAQVRPMGVGLDLWACRRDGSEFPVEISLSPLETEDGLLVSSAIRDISKRKEAEKAHRESESKFRNIIEANPLGIHIYQLQPDGRLIFVEANPAADKILGIDHDQFAGKIFESAFPEITQTELPDELRRVAADGGIWSTDGFGYEGGGISGVFEATVFQTSPANIAVAFRDITTRKAIEEEQIRLMRTTEQQREQLRILARQLVDAQESERKDLARELHDRVGQNLAALDFNVSRVRELMPFDAPAGHPIHQMSGLVEASSAILTQTAETIRDVMAELRPPMLDDFGLMAALNWYGSQYVTPRGIAFMVSGEEIIPRLAPEVELALFRIAQEAIANILKHAQASTVIVCLKPDVERDIVRLTLIDDGIGFEPARRAGPADRQSWGLLGMKERAVAVGANCRIESIPGQGTQVVVEVNL